MNIVNIVILLVAILALGISLYTLFRKERYTGDQLLAVDPQGNLEFLNKVPQSFQALLDKYLKDSGYVKDGDLINLGLNPSQMLLGSCDGAINYCGGNIGAMNITSGSHPEQKPYQKGNNTTWMVFNNTSKPK